MFPAISRIYCAFVFLSFFSPDSFVSSVISPRVQMPIGQHIMNGFCRQPAPVQVNAVRPPAPLCIIPVRSAPRSRYPHAGVLSRYPWANAPQTVNDSLLPCISPRASPVGQADLPRSGHTAEAFSPMSLCSSDEAPSPMIRAPTPCVESLERAPQHQEMRAEPGKDGSGSPTLDTSRFNLADDRSLFNSVVLGVRSFFTFMRWVMCGCV